MEEGRHALTLNEFAALSQSKTIIEKITKLRNESIEYQYLVYLTNSIPFDISTQNLLETINTVGNVGEIRE